jgi:hypothetical protein
VAYDSRPDTYAHIARVQHFVLSCAHALMARAEVHDASKLVDPELATFNEYTPKLRETTYGSDDYKRYLAEMGKALEHHYAENSHHPEHFEDGIQGMTLLDVVEMLCDWIAACERHPDGDIDRSISQNRERFGYGDDLERILRNTVEVLSPARLRS